MARVLVVDDDAALLDVLTLELADAGHDVDRASDGSEALIRIESARPELVICDVNMPALDGFTLCRRLRDAGDLVPLILLTSRDNAIDEALGLDLGADDYVTKPFSTRVLLARVSALLRREKARATDASPSIVRVGKLTIDPERLEARYAGELIVTTVTELRLLEALASRPGIVFSRERLMERMRGDDSVVAPRIVDTYVRRLRKKIEAIAPDDDPIETIVGAGYRLR